MTEAVYPRVQTCVNCRRDAGLTLKMTKGQPVYACQHCTVTFTANVIAAMPPQIKECPHCDVEKGGWSQTDNQCVEENWDTGEKDTQILWQCMKCAASYYFWKVTGEYC